MFHRLARPVLIGAALALALAACGRRGPLEPPPDPSAPKENQQTTERTDGATSLSGTPVGAPKKAPRAFTIPKDPFILDPLL